MKKLSMDELNRLSIEDFKNSEKRNFCLVLDDIRSMSNVGSIFRTSDCFLVFKLFLCGITSTPPHREIEKTAIGATESVDWEYRSDVIELLNELKKGGWKIVSLEQVAGSISLTDFRPTLSDKYVFVLGNEVFGVKQEIVEMSDFVIEIPQFGTKHSFNVSVSNGILLWDFYSKTIGNVLDKPA